jgi:hypothetical protein
MGGREGREGKEGEGREGKEGWREGGRGNGEKGSGGKERRGGKGRKGGVEGREEVSGPPTFSDRSPPLVFAEGQGCKHYMVLDYNMTKGAVDAFDQEVSYYTCAHKTRRWPMRLF